MDRARGPPWEPHSLLGEEDAAPGGRVQPGCDRAGRGRCGTEGGAYQVLGATPDTGGMISVDERAALLDETSWVRGLSWAQVRAVASYMEVTTAPAGTLLVAEGDRDAFLCVIAMGTADVAKRDADRVERHVTRLLRGHCFGEMSLLDGEPRSASVRAATDLTLLCLSAQDLERLVDEKPRLGAEVFRRLGRAASQYLRRTSGQLVDVLDG